MSPHTVDEFNLLQPSLCKVCSEQKCDFSLLSSSGVIALNMFEFFSLSLWSQTGSLVLAFSLRPAGGTEVGFCSTDCAAAEHGLVQSAYGVNTFLKLLLARSLKTQAGCNLSMGSLDTARGVLFSCSPFLGSAVLNCFLLFYQRQQVILTSQLLLSHSESSAGVSNCNSTNICSRKLWVQKVIPVQKEREYICISAGLLHVLSRNFNWLENDLAAYANVMDR